MDNMIPAKDVKPDMLVFVDGHGAVVVSDVTISGELVTMFVRVFGSLLPVYLAPDTLVELAK